MKFTSIFPRRSRFYPIAKQIYLILHFRAAAYLLKRPLHSAGKAKRQHTRRGSTGNLQRIAAGNHRRSRCYHIVDKQHMLFPHLRLRHKHPCHIGMAVGNASMSLRGVTLYGSKRLNHPYARSRRNPRCYIRTLIAQPCPRRRKIRQTAARMQTSAPCRRQSADCCDTSHL